MTASRTSKVVERADTEVMYVRAEDGIVGGPTAFSQLEAAIGSMRGRRFFGVVEPNGEYFAAVRREADDDPDEFGLLCQVIPGGAYARTTIRDWPNHLSEIGAEFNALARIYQEDVTRPSIEYYRSERELILLLPVEIVSE